MHYLGMYAMRLNGALDYDVFTVALSILIAIAAATAALWAAVTIRGFLTSLGASLVMGVAVSGMHYTAMAAVSVHVHGTTGGSWAGASASSLLLPMLVGPVIFLVLAGVVVMFDPLLVLGDGDWSRPTARQKPVVPPAEEAPAPTHSSLFETPAVPSRARPHPYDTPQRAGEW
jgi:hypothetical protein